MCADWMLEIGVHEGDVIVAADDVAEGGETLFDALDADGIREGVTEVLEFLVGGGGGEEETVAVTITRIYQPQILHIVLWKEEHTQR